MKKIPGQKPSSGFVLVVDDEEANRTLLCDPLRAHGYEVEEAENGLVALEKILRRPPDVILLDVMMPKMDGIEVRHRGGPLGRGARRTTTSHSVGQPPAVRSVRSVRGRSWLVRTVSVTCPGFVGVGGIGTNWCQNRAGARHSGGAKMPTANSWGNSGSATLPDAQKTDQKGTEIPVKNPPPEDRGAALFSREFRPNPGEVFESVSAVSAPWTVRRSDLAPRKPRAGFSHCSGRKDRPRLADRRGPQHVEGGERRQHQLG